LCFYKIANVLMAPNEDLIKMLQAATAKDVLPMRRGIDINLFNPSRRTINDSVLRFGFVGRLSPEKSVRNLIDIEQYLLSQGFTNFQFLIVGDGGERKWLEQNLSFAEFTGVLKGKQLAEAYANMDLFLFPSKTDTFGNVVLEALSSGVPAIVTNEGGPRFLIKDKITGFIASDENEFLKSILTFIRMDKQSRMKMKSEARLSCCQHSWNSVVDEVYDAYQLASLKNIVQNIDAPIVRKTSPLRILQMLKVLVLS